jgi:hypothetical protein
VVKTGLFLVSVGWPYGPTRPNVGKTHRAHDRPTEDDPMELSLVPSGTEPSTHGHYRPTDFVDRRQRPILRGLKAGGTLASVKNEQHGEEKQKFHVRPLLTPTDSSPACLAESSQG